VSAHLRYLSYVVRHKWFVFLAGLRTGAPLWRLVVHDWSKFLPAEWAPYVAYFYGPKEPPAHVLYSPNGRPNVEANRADWLAERQAAFDRAWLHHQHANPHHWQHWILREDSGAQRLLPMPDSLVREMVADWMGAGRAITGRWEAAEWYRANAHRMSLAPETAGLVESLLAATPRVLAKDGGD
jgi:hypothetical protein